MKTTTANRHKIKSLLKKQHGVDLTDPQLDTIEEIQLESKIDFRIELLFKRSMNLIFGIIGILFFFLIQGTPGEKWFYIIYVSNFTIYNLIFVIINWKQFQKENEKSRREIGRN